MAECVSDSGSDSETKERPTTSSEISVSFYGSMSSHTKLNQNGCLLREKKVNQKFRPMIVIKIQNILLKNDILIMVMVLVMREKVLGRRLLSSLSNNLK